MMRRLLVLMLVAMVALSFGCAKKAAGPCPAAGTEAAPAAAAPGAPAAQAPAAPAAPAEEGLAAPGAPGAPEAKAAGMNAQRFESQDIYFAYDSSDITPESAAILDAKAAYLKANPGVKVMIEGNCDERGSSEYNLALGERRAHAAKRYLVNAGIPSDRLDTVSYGEERPADPGHDEEAWAKNRRDHFDITTR